MHRPTCVSVTHALYNIAKSNSELYNTAKRNSEKGLITIDSALTNSLYQPLSIILFCTQSSLWHQLSKIANFLSHTLTPNL